MIAIMSEWLSNVFDALASHTRSIGAGAHLFHRDDPVASMHLVSNGRIDLVRHSEGGRAIVLQRAGRGDIIAEASLFSERSHCDAIATTPVSVLCIPRQTFRDRLLGDPEFAERRTAHLGQEIQSMRFRNEVLSLQTVAARLDAWLAWHDRLPDRGEWKQLAGQIGVSPEALYREMAKRRH